ncbi:unnamed protein product [Ilex paraguariensis]|uniref:Ferroxidase n=1 Tax=Ilex paraguariensis TaxID=185542 RepID=A0ABC8T3N0_9AQUA
MASPSSTKLILLRRLSRALKLKPPSASIQRSSSSSSSLYLSSLPEASRLAHGYCLSICCRNFCSRPPHLNDESQGPVTIYNSVLLQEDEYHRLADTTIQDLLEKIEEYGDTVEIDGFDIEYGNQVLTLKLGSLGTYVLNKQTPNRQIWMSSPVREKGREKSCGEGRRVTTGLGVLPHHFLNHIYK